MALAVIALYPTGFYFGFDSLVSAKRNALNKRQHVEGNEDAAVDSEFNCEMGRRTWLKSLGAIPLLGLFGIAFFRKMGLRGIEDMQLIKHTRIDPDAYTSPTRKIVKYNLADLSDRTMPMGEIKRVKISRIIVGGNQINGVAHARDLIYASPLVVNYFTDEKIMIQRTTLERTFFYAL